MNTDVYCYLRPCCFDCINADINYQVSDDGHWPSIIEIKDLFPGWMDYRYLTQNYHNLQEKYDFGAITDEEWDRIEERYRELIGK